MFTGLKLVAVLGGYRTGWWQLYCSRTEVGSSTRRLLEGGWLQFQTVTGLDYHFLAIDLLD